VLVDPCLLTFYRFLACSNITEVQYLNYFEVAILHLKQVGHVMKPFKGN